MPRCARIKESNGIYHIMVRSVGDTNLYRDNDDKIKFLEKVAKYQEKMMFKIYAYCLMDTHGHIIIDSNGGDISTIMHSINQSYAQYFNRRHKRHGHLFADRFKSIMITDEAYLYQLSGYIHQNPKDLPDFNLAIEKYPFSSLGIYLGIFENRYEIVDPDFILSNFGNDVNSARSKYRSFINLCTDMKSKEHMEFLHEKSQYRSERKILVRDFTPDQISNFISGYLNKEEYCIRYKNSSEHKEIRGIFVFLTRLLCGYTYKEVCAYMGNITASQARSLFDHGFNVLKRLGKVNIIISDLISIQKCIDTVSA